MSDNTLPYGTTTGDLILAQLLATAVANPIEVDTVGDLGRLTPTAGRVAEVGQQDIYLADGSEWVAAEDAGLAGTGSVKTKTLHLGPDGPAASFSDISGPRVRTVTTDYTASDGEFVLVDASAGAVTVTLPDPAEHTRVGVKKTDGSANAVTVATPTTGTIDGDTTLSLGAAYATAHVAADGSDYFVEHRTGYGH